MRHINQVPLYVIYHTFVMMRLKLCIQYLVFHEFLELFLIFIHIRNCGILFMMMSETKIISNKNKYCFSVRFVCWDNGGKSIHLWIVILIVLFMHINKTDLIITVFSANMNVWTFLVVGHIEIITICGNFAPQIVAFVIYLCQQHQIQL